MKDIFTAFSPLFLLCPLYEKRGSQALPAPSLQDEVGVGVCRQEAGVFSWDAPVQDPPNRPSSQCNRAANLP